MRRGSTLRAVLLLAFTSLGSGAVTWAACGPPVTLDAAGVYALMFKDTSLGFVEQVKTMFKHTKRLADS